MMFELTLENKVILWQKRCGKLEIDLQDEQHKRAYYQQEYGKAVRAIKALIGIVKDYDEKH